MYDKASPVTKGYPVTTLTIIVLGNYGKYILTIARCAAVNPAENLLTPEDGEPDGDCVQEAERYSKLRSDLQALPLLDADVEYWTDGSCSCSCSWYHVDDKLSAGYAVVRPQGVEFVIENAEVIPQPASAQLAELVGLTSMFTS